MVKILVFLLLLVASSASADTMRCRDGLVSLEATKQETISKCGEPAGRESYPREINKYGAAVMIDQWTYDFGPTQFVYIVYFEQGKVVKIEGTTTRGSSR